MRPSSCSAAVDILIVNDTGQFSTWGNLLYDKVEKNRTKNPCLYLWLDKIEPRQTVYSAMLAEHR